MPNRGTGINLRMQQKRHLKELKGKSLFWCSVSPLIAVTSQDPNQCT